MRALVRIVAILEAVATAQPATVTSVAARVGLSVPTASRLMRELVDEGLLDRSDATGAYALGGRLIAIARTASEGNPLLEIALPIMEEIRNLTEETVSLHVRAGQARLCIAEVQSRHAVRRVVPVGLTLPLHYGGTGEVLLANLDESERDDYLRQLNLSTSERRRLETRLAKTRATNYAIAVGAFERELAGFAVPVSTSDGQVAALAVSGPSSRWTPSVMRRHAKRIQHLATQISARALGLRAVR